ncbi:MAG: phosphatase PAP2 family protein [Clostridiales bacterium]|nr:phosphatase PAP2 family protein [Clostridiales bacterium]
MEETILLFIQEHIRNPILDPIFKTITHLGDKGIFWIILTVILLSVKKTRAAGICSACALLSSFLVNNLLLKNLFNRTRPYEVIEGLTCIIQPAADASFPSGHTGASFASAVAIYRNIPRKYGILLLILASLIAFSRLYVGIHYPTDVLGGLATGIALGILASPRKHRVRTMRNKR